MATLIVPGTYKGSVRPYGYFIDETVADDGSVYIEVPSDVHQIGLQVSGVTTGYFLWATMNDPDLVGSDDASVEWFDLLGNGTDAQTVAKQVSIEGTPTVIKLSGSAAGAAATLSATFRRV